MLSCRSCCDTGVVRCRILVVNISVLYVLPVGVLTFSPFQPSWLSFNRTSLSPTVHVPAQKDPVNDQPSRFDRSVSFRREARARRRTYCLETWLLEFHSLYCIHVTTHLPTNYMVMSCSLAFASNLRLMDRRAARLKPVQSHRCCNDRFVL
eukprot:752258-Hanusia_phi.AAC.3